MAVRDEDQLEVLDLMRKLDQLAYRTMLSARRVRNVIVSNPTMEGRGDAIVNDMALDQALRRLDDDSQAVKRDVDAISARIDSGEIL